MSQQDCLVRAVKGGVPEGQSVLCAAVSAVLPDAEFGRTQGDDGRRIVWGGRAW